MVTDFHTHILPALDDGSSSPEESIEMLRMETAQGIEHIVATPHFYPHSHDLARFIERRRRAEEQLRAALEQHADMPRISIGAEVHYFAGISDFDKLSEFAVDNGKFILVEMPHAPWSKKMYQELADISAKQGLTPIIAHVDRYISPFKKHKIPEQLANLPVLVQANASFFLQSGTRRMALRMLQEGQIHLLGSDCHNCSSRPPNLEKAVQVIERRLGYEAIERIRHYENRVFLTCNSFV